MERRRESSNIGESEAGDHPMKTCGNIASVLREGRVYWLLRMFLRKTSELTRGWVCPKFRSCVDSHEFLFQLLEERRVFKNIMGAC